MTSVLAAVSTGGLRRALGVAAACLLSLVAQAQGLQPVPALTAHVMDRTATLQPQQVAALEAKLAELEASKGSQVVVLLVPTTQPEDIASYTQRVGSTWKIGRKGVGDGLLVVVAKDDHRIDIAPAKTLEGAVPDLLASRIIKEQITPRFKLGDYAGGLDAGVQALSAAIRGEALPEVAPEHQAWQGQQGAQFDWTTLAIFLFVLVPVGGAIARGIFGRGLGSLVTGGGIGVLAFFLTTSLLIAIGAGMVAMFFTLLGGLSLGAGRGRSGSWGGGGFGGGGFGGGGMGGGGGGFSSGGGGSFGGGGASGSW